MVRHSISVIHETINKLTYSSEGHAIRAGCDGLYQDYEKVQGISSIPLWRMPENLCDWAKRRARRSLATEKIELARAKQKRLEILISVLDEYYLDPNSDGPDLDVVDWSRTLDPSQCLGNAEWVNAENLVNFVEQA